MFKKILPAMVMATVMASAVAPTTASAHDRGRDGWKKHRHYDRGNHYGYRCKRDNGTGGLVIGAIAGGLLGNEVARDKTAGTIIGGGVGALAGRAIDRSDSRC